MATIAIHKTDGSQAGSLELNDSVFAVEPSMHCVRAAVTQYRANQRAGTHSTKTRAFVRGGGRKPWKQKGTGRARQGSIRSAQWRHGAITFGPLPRDHSFSINIKVRQKALRSVWTELVTSGRLIVVDCFGLDKPKTKAIVAILDALGVDGTALLVTAHTEEATALAARNLPWVTALNVDNLNVYDLLTHDWVVATQDAIQRVEATYA